MLLQHRPHTRIPAFPQRRRLRTLFSDEDEPAKIVGLVRFLHRTKKSSLLLLLSRYMVPIVVNVPNGGGARSVVPILNAARGVMNASPTRRKSTGWVRLDGGEVTRTIDSSDSA